MLSRLSTMLKAHRVSLLVLIGAWLLFFGAVFLRGHLFYLDDLKIIYYPLEHEYAQAQTDLRLQQWSHLFGFGQPLMAWGQLGFFTPLHVLLRLLQLHPLILLQVSIAGYFLLGLLGMYAYLQRQKLSQPASSLGALLFVFTGFTIGHLNHVNFYTSTMWLPWLLLTAAALISKPTFKTSLLLTLVATATTISGQPQVVLYTFIIAGIISLAHLFTTYPTSTWKRNQAPLRKTIGLTLLAAALTVGLAAHSILPLAEFLPLTERNSPVPRQQLLEFSYPPYHAITLIAPYFFGNHDTYWGAKGFQELAAFTGIIPLMLAGISFLNWRSQRSLRIAGLVLISIAVLFALGKHSPLYAYLIEHQFITTLNIPGRFVYFFNIGLLLLAALGLNDLTRPQQTRRFQQMAALAFPLLLLTPFLVQLSEPAIRERFVEFTSIPNASWLLAVGGGIITIATLRTKKNYKSSAWILTSTAAITLLFLSIPYNPTTPAQEALRQTPFSSELQAYQQQTGLPARLYAREDLKIGGHQNASSQQHTESISEQFTVYQPLPANLTHECLVVSMNATPGNSNPITISLHAAINEPALGKITRTESSIYHQPNQMFCFPQLEDNPSPLFLKFSSTEPTTVSLQTELLPSDVSHQQAYFVRVPLPNADQIERSRKPLMIKHSLLTQNPDDLERLLLARHLNVTAGASSARWIGALSIRPYREFIEKFFANDQEHPIDGDGVHTLQRHRNLVNMAGITHFASTINPVLADDDPFLNQNYQLEAEIESGTQLLRLYRNPHAFPKAYLVPQAQFIPAADELRTALIDPSYDPQSLVYIDGPTPPTNLPDSPTPLDYQAEITSYTPTEVTVDVTTDHEAVLVLTDTSTPQWQTYIDGQLSPRYTANSFFKTAIVPAGQHTVTFRYQSPAIKQANTIASVSLLVLTLWIVIQSSQFFHGKA